MQIVIQVEFLKEPGRDIELHRITRVPCVGEFLCVGEESHEVYVVLHLLSKDNIIKAIVRVT